MKILLLNREYPPVIGGSGVLSQNLAEEWVKLGHQVDVVTGVRGGGKSFERLNGVNVYRVDTFSKSSQTNALSAIAYIILGTAKAVRLQLKNQYDILFTFFATLGGPIGLIVSRIFHVRNILTIIGGDIYEPSRSNSPHRYAILRTAVRFILDRAQRIVAISSDTKANAMHYYHPAKAIQVIPIGFRTTSFSRVARASLGLDDNKKYIISVGRMAARKNFPNLLTAFSHVHDESIELILVGDGPMRDELRFMANNLHIEKRVHFVGAVPEERKFQYLSVADMFVLPSWHEGFGIAYQEAMHCGLPVIASTTGGQTDFLTNENNAILVRPESVEEISKAIKRLLSDMALREKLVANAKITMQQFELGNIARSYLNLAHEH